LILRAVIESAPVLVVALSCTVTILVPSVLGDVVTGVSRFTVVDGAFSDRGHLVPLGVLGMNRGLSLMSGGLRRLLRGKPTSPRGRTFGLLHGSGLEESSDFIADPTGLGV
jgi:predicted phage tail protein